MLFGKPFQVFFGRALWNIFQSDRAFVSALFYRRKNVTIVYLTRSRMMPSGNIRDLYVPDAARVFLKRRDDVALHPLHMKNIVQI